MITVLIAENEKKWKEVLEKVLISGGYALGDVDHVVRVVREEGRQDPYFLKQLAGNIKDFFRTQEEGHVYKSILETVERPLIEAALERSDGNQLKAAKVLGINRNTIRTKIKRLGIDVKRWKTAHEI